MRLVPGETQTTGEAVAVVITTSNPEERGQFFLNSSIVLLTIVLKHINVSFHSDTFRIHFFKHQFLLSMPLY